MRVAHRPYGRFGLRVAHRPYGCFRMRVAHRPYARFRVRRCRADLSTGQGTVGAQARQAREARWVVVVSDGGVRHVATGHEVPAVAVARRASRRMSRTQAVTDGAPGRSRREVKATGRRLRTFLASRA